jgi:hypothetical protein
MPKCLSGPFRCVHDKPLFWLLPTMDHQANGTDGRIGHCIGRSLTTVNLVVR